MCKNVQVSLCEHGGWHMEGDVHRSWRRHEGMEIGSGLQMCGRDQGLGQFPLSSPVFALMVTGRWVFVHSLDS